MGHTLSVFTRYVFCWYIVWGAVGSSRGSGTLEYNRDIRPILTENCFACHGQDPESRGADLRLDLREDALAMGAITPGNVEESEIWNRIISDDPDVIMPPPNSHKELTAEDREILKRWIEEGAEYQGHWAFDAPIKPELPQVRNGSWVKNPIDRFVLAELESRGLEPAPEADLRSLIRRVSLDITGLPPTPDDIKRVLANPSPQRYEEYVDELLQRPEWGEHRARYWLDYARYADTHGIHFDNYREIWAYRDWVIKAYNNNQPFDQFTLEQLAGDLLPEPSLDQKIATGFSRCNITTNEGGVIEEEYKVLYTRDRVETTGLVWLGLTVGCAVCHDHKYDPVSQAEFYQLAAFFNNTTQPVMDGNIKDTPPVIQVPMDSDRERAVSVQTEIADAQGRLLARREASQQAFHEYLSQSAKSTDLKWPEPLTSTAPKTHIPLTGADPGWIDVIHEGKLRRVPLDIAATLSDGIVAEKGWKVTKAFPTLPVGDFERDQAFSVSLWVNPADRQGGSLVARMDEANGHRGWDVWTEGGFVGIHVIHNWPEDALKVVSRDQLPGNRWSHVAVTYDGSSTIEGLKVYVNGNEIARNVTASSLTNTIRTEVPLSIGKRSSGGAAINATLQDVQIFDSLLAIDEIRNLKSQSRQRYILSKKERSPEELEELFVHYLATEDAESIQLNQMLSDLRKEEATIRSRGTLAHIMNEAETEPIAHVLIRGDYDKRGDEVRPDTPKALLPMPEEFPKSRLGFAQWLLLPDHPLTARVTVNRFWQEVFGEGIVRSVGDFGITGQLPTHPDLLDYLAVSFREDGWDIKKYYRDLVTSATYRQSASVAAEKYAMDPENKLLARGPRFRMDAEMIRDSALSISGLLVPKLGGPSVNPYQPPGVWEAVAMPGSDTRFYRQGTGESLYRRSLYTFLKRAAPPPNMEVFNATAREVCTIRRERTNTPLQALVTLNDTQFVEAARIVATNLLKDPDVEPEIVARIQWLAEKMIGRPFRMEELQVVQDRLADLQKHYDANPEQAAELLAVGDTRSESDVSDAELAAWTMLCNLLMNLDEVITK